MKKRMIATNTFEMQVPGNDRLTLEFEVEVMDMSGTHPMEEDFTIEVLSANLFLSVEGMNVDSIVLLNSRIVDAFKQDIEEFVIKNWWKLNFKELEKDDDDGE